MNNKKEQCTSANVKPFATITEAVRITGLSAYFLRRGIKEGTVPYIQSGRKYLVNIPALLRQLGAL